MADMRCEELDQLIFNYIKHTGEITDDEFFDSLADVVERNKNSSNNFQYSKKISVDLMKQIVSDN